MKKIFLLTIAFTILISGCGQKTANPTNTQLPAKPQTSITKETATLDNAKQQVINYNNYIADPQEIKKVVNSQDNTLYYYGTDNKRYTFPNQDIFKSWFGEVDIKTLKIETKETLYKTELGGNVTLRPGSLMATETDPNVYLIIKNGQIKVIDQNILNEIYGNNWKRLIYNLPNFYFTQYENIGTITNVKDFPNIIPKMSINQDKGL